MFCPNCGTQNPETAQTCSKCAFNLKGAAAPKFKGTMLMMNQPGGAAAPPAPPRPAGIGTPAPAPAPPGFGAPSAGPSKLKGTMVGVAPPVPGAAPQPPGFGAPPGQGGAFGAPPAQDAAAQFQPPGQGPANPLAGTVAADNAGAFGAQLGQQPAQGGGGGFGAPPGQDPYAQQQQQQQQPQGGGFPPPQQQQYGGPPQQQQQQQQQQQGGFGGQMQPSQSAAQDFGNAAAGAFGQVGDAAGQAYGGMAQAAGYGGGPMQQQGPGGYGGPPPGGFGGMGGGPMGPGAPGQINTTQPLILAIVSVLCCWPAAVVAIIFAVQGKKLAEQGQIDQAMAKLKTSKLIAFIAIGLGVVGIIINVIVRVVFH